MNCYRNSQHYLQYPWKHIFNIFKLHPQAWRKRKLWTILMTFFLVVILLLQIEWTPNDILHVNSADYPKESVQVRKVKVPVPKANLSHPVFSNFTSEELKLFEKAWSLQAPWKERTIAQVALIDIVQRHRVLKEKVIYTMNNKQPEGSYRWKMENCESAPCRFTHNHSEALDAVIYDNDYYYPERMKKKPGQTWIFIRLENPLNPQPPSEVGDKIDWMVTYWTKSLLISPYNNWSQRYPRYPGLRITNFITPSERDFSKGKTKKVVWFASNCYAMNDRLEYAVELGKHIQVDIYGNCGNLTCPRTKEPECFDMIKKDYKFYLAFENSNCHDYITEKFWRALQYDAIPIVMGAKPKEYDDQVPPNSYIHVDDYANAEDLAKTLHKLDADPVLYNKYFAWRKDPGENLEFQQFCRICAMLHAVDWIKSDQRPKQAKTLMKEYFHEKACVPWWKKRKQYQSMGMYEEDYESPLKRNNRLILERKSAQLRPAHLRNRNIPTYD